MLVINNTNSLRLLTSNLILLANSLILLAKKEIKKQIINPK